jgi:hypothetical protein
MERMQRQLSGFLEAIEDEGRIGPIHICVYFVLFDMYAKQSFRNPVTVYSKDAMRLSKILSRDSYLRCIKELAEMGHIRFESSRKKNQPSRIFIEEKYV